MKIEKKDYIRVKCPLCTEAIASTALRCPHCTGDLTDKKIEAQIFEQLRKKEILKRATIWTFLAILTISIAFAVIMSLGS